MFKKSILCLLITLNLVLIGCNHETTPKDNIKEPEINHTTDDKNTDLKGVDDFKDLTKNTNREEVIGKYGEPIKDIGSGLHIYIYSVKEGMLTIYFGLNDKISKIELQKIDGSQEDILK